MTNRSNVIVQTNSQDAPQSTQRHRIGECYEANRDDAVITVVIIGYLPPNPHGDLGESKLQCRDLEGTGTPFEISAADVGKRVHFYEVVEMFMKKGWTNPLDIAAYLADYGVEFRDSTVVTYVTQYRRHGSTKPPTSNRLGSTANRPLDKNVFERLSELQIWIDVVGGTDRAIKLVAFQEQIGGLAYFKKALVALKALQTLR